MAYKRFRSSTQTRTKRQTSRSGVTQHYDRQVQYVKKRMPYRKRKRWTSFVKKVHAANERQLGTKTLVYSVQVTGTTSAVGGQNWQFCSLYGVNGSGASSEKGATDLYQIFQQAYDAALENQKLTFKSAVLDLTLTNTGTNKLEVDLYHLSYWGSPALTSFNATHNEAVNDTPTMDPNGTAFFGPLSLAKRGVTPFDIPALMKLGKFTIVKKVKYWIDVGDTITYQIRDAKTHVISESSVLESNKFAQAKLTQSLYINFKPVAGAAETEGNSLTMGVTRKYSLNSADDKDQDGWANV